MSDDNKAVSTTKLVVIDTKTLVAESFEGNYKCGKANLPDPKGDDKFTAKELIGQLNDFRESADGARYRADAAAEKKSDIAKKFGELTAEYKGWYDRLVPQEELDTFGL